MNKSKPEPYLWFDPDTYQISRVKPDRPTYIPLYDRGHLLHWAADQGFEDYQNRVSFYRADQKLRELAEKEDVPTI